MQAEFVLVTGKPIDFRIQSSKISKQMIKRPPGYRLQGSAYLFSNINVIMCFILLASEEAKKKSIKRSIAFIETLKRKKIELHNYRFQLLYY